MELFEITDGFRLKFSIKVSSRMNNGSSKQKTWVFNEFLMNACNLALSRSYNSLVRYKTRAFYTFRYLPNPEGN